MATFITGVLTFLLTGRLDFAVTVGVFDTLVKFLIYYFHERMWARFRFGKVPPAEYQI